MISKVYQTFYEAALKTVPKDRIFTDPLRTLTYGTDASFYRLIPQIVINAENEKEVIALLRLAYKSRLPVTFRAAGTSLSGQSVTDSILIRLGENWTRYKISDDASQITLQPGIIGAFANKVLAEFGKKIGPDPASIDTAKIGGIVANNASGMCCGVAENSYKTLHSMRIVLADGTVLDTSDAKSKRDFMRSHPHVMEQIRTLSQKVKEDEKLSSRIRRKFKIKNTTGYSLNALVDFEDPFEITQHLLVGSEGTLGFISEVTYRTVVEHPYKASALMLFPDIRRACEATILLKKEPVSAVELMDRAALASVQDKPGMPSYLHELDKNAAAILVETRAEDAKTLHSQIDEITKALENVEKIRPIEFTDIPGEYSKLWLIRKGLFPAVGAVRKTGTTVIIEDVAFPIEDLAKATHELQELLTKYHYHEAIIFGHALEGNLHFVFTQDFNNPKEVERYSHLMDEVCELVVHKYNGSLKAEHGTGRNMAPFVEMEWGREAYDLMKKIKRIFDPQNILNPGVILNDDSKVHLKNLKPLPKAHDVVDKCIECGFCEPICPSKDLTFTPRHRIVGWREINRLGAEGKETAALKKFRKQYDYPGNYTCATDGLCATRCPVGINTGLFIKDLRSHELSASQKKSADWIASNMSKSTSIIRAGLSTAQAIQKAGGGKLLENGSMLARKVAGSSVPQWNPWLPGKAGRVQRVAQTGSGRKVVYSPSCICRTMGTALDEQEKADLHAITVALLRKAGFDVLLPEGMDKLCCGMPFASKGYKEQAETKARELEGALLAASQGGAVPVLCDTSPCLYHMKETLSKRLKLYEPIEFTLEFLAPHLKFTPVDEPIAIHTTCSARKLGLADRFRELAELCSTKVTVPDNMECCGFAGDRGFTYPELNASALKGLDEQVHDCQAGYSTSKTCEIGLSLHGKIPYRSIFYLVDRVTVPLAKT